MRAAGARAHDAILALVRWLVCPREAEPVRLTAEFRAAAGSPGDEPLALRPRVEADLQELPAGKPRRDYAVCLASCWGLSRR